MKKEAELRALCPSLPFTSGRGEETRLTIIFFKNSRIKGTTLKKLFFQRIVKAHADTRIRLGIVRCGARNQTTGHTDGSGLYLMGHLSLLQGGSSLACLQYLDSCSVFRGPSEFRWQFLSFVSFLSLFFPSDYQHISLKKYCCFSLCFIHYKLFLVSGRGRCSSSCST